MSTKNFDIINVYNTNNSVLIIPTKDRDRQLRLSPAVGGVPSMVPMTFAELDFFNNNSSAVRDGIVEFSEDVREAVYKALRISNWENILFGSVIKGIIKKPTMEGLQRIVDVTSVGVIERIRGMFTYMKNDGYDVSTKVESIINTRYSEIARRKPKTEIVLAPKENVVATAVAGDVDTLKAENQEMRNKMAEMEAMLSRLMEQKSTKAKSKDSE